MKNTRTFQYNSIARDQSQKEMPCWLFLLSTVLPSLVISSLDGQAHHHHQLDFSDLPAIDLGLLMEEDNRFNLGNDLPPMVMADTRSYREGEEGLDSDVMDVRTSLLDITSPIV